MGISKRNARLIRAGVKAAYLPHRLRGYWLFEKHDPLTWRAFMVASERSEAHMRRWHIRVNGYDPADLAAVGKRLMKLTNVV